MRSDSSLPRGGSGRLLAGTLGLSETGEPREWQGGRAGAGAVEAWRAEPALGVLWSQGCGHRGGTEQGKPAGAGHCSGGPVSTQPVGTRCSRQIVQDTCGPGAGGCPGCGRLPSHCGCSQFWPPPASDAGVSLQNLPGARGRAHRQRPAGSSGDQGTEHPSREPCDISGTVWRGSGQASWAESYVRIAAAPARGRCTRRDR